MTTKEIARENRRILNQAAERMTGRSSLNLDKLPFVRDEDGTTPLEPLFTAPRSAVLTESEVAAIEREEQRSLSRKKDR